MGREGWRRMKANLGALRLAIGLVASLSVCGPALSQKPGGILRLPALDSPEYVDPRRIEIAVLGSMMGCRPIIVYSRGAACWSLTSRG